MQQPSSGNHVLSPAVTPPRPNRLLYRRGLPDLPELIEAEEDEGTVYDDMSVNTLSTRHSASTSASSREFPSAVNIAALSVSTIPQSPKNAIPSQTRQTKLGHEVYSQTPPDSVIQLQNPFEYLPSNSFRLNPHQLGEEASPPPSPSPRDEALLNAGLGFGLGVNISATRNFHQDGSGINQKDYFESGIQSGVYGDDTCNVDDCRECFDIQATHHSSFGPIYEGSASGEGITETGDYMSPPSSPESEYADDQDLFYGLAVQSFHSLDRPRSPSLLLDNDAFSSVPTLPTFPPHPTTAEEPPIDSGRPRGLLGRKGTAVLNKVLPRSLRLKRWASTPTLPKLQISSPPPLPRMASTTVLPSPTQPSRSAGPSIPANTAFDYDPYSDRHSDDEDEDESRRPTTRGTMMSREQLPTPPFLPSVAPSLPYIPPLESPVSLSFPQSPSASVHNVNVSSQPLFSPSLVQPTVRNNSLTSLSNQSLTSNTQVPSPTTFVSPNPRPSDVHSPSMAPPILNMSSLRGVSTPQQSPQLTQRQFPILNPDENKVEDLLHQMELEDNAFAATEERMASTGWSTEAELGELRAKRQVVRKEWEERIEVARKKRRGSDGLSTHSGSMSMETSVTPVITLQATPNLTSAAIITPSPAQI